MPYRIMSENTHSNFDLIPLNDEIYQTADQAQKRLDQLFPIPGTLQKLAECGLVISIEVSGKQ